MIFAFRHPKPAIATGTCYGQLDVALAEPAEAAAQVILAAVGQERFGRIVSSPLRRAREVAVVLADRLRLPLVLEPRLQEMSFGNWEGRAWAAIARGEIDAWAADTMSYRPGGGERAGDLMDRVAALWREAQTNGEHQLWLTHAGPMRCLLALQSGRPLAEFLDRPIAYGALLKFAPTGDSRFSDESGRP
jgi:alpha-ribazole phosphatase